MGFYVSPFGKEEEVQSRTFFLILIAMAMTQRKKSDILYFLFLLKMVRVFVGTLYFNVEVYRMQSYRFLITGKVQGVWYRKSVVERAVKQGFFGYVKNLEDGSVEAGAALEDDGFALFIAILEEGSMGSRVDNIEQFESNEEFLREFEIR